MHYFTIFRAIKKRHATQLQQQQSGNHRGTGHHHNNSSVVQAQAHANEESYREERRCAAVLFTIVILFFVSHAPRILLNFYEFFAIEEFKDPCYHIPLWTMILTCVSLLFMTINSSVNFFVYCFANSRFRQEILQRWAKFKALFSSSAHQHQQPSPENQIQLQVVKYLCQFSRGAAALPMSISWLNFLYSAQLLPKGDMHTEEIGGNGGGGGNNGGCSKVASVET